MKHLTCVVAAVAAGTLALAAGCGTRPGISPGPRRPDIGGSPAGTATPAQSPDGVVIGAAPGPPSTGPGQVASCAKAQRWNTEPKHAGTAGSPAAVFNVRVGQHPGECYDRVNFDLNGPDEVGYFADYVTRDQVVDEGAGAPLTVPGNAFLRVVIIAPILGRDTQGHQPWRSPPRPGLQLLDPLQIQGWPTVTGVVYAGGHPNETAIYIGLQGQFAFNVDATSVSPKSQTRIVSVDIRRSLVAEAAGVPIEVPLGAHQFNALTPPDGVVARVGANGVGWEQPAEGALLGPWSFEIGADGRTWLLDELNKRLLGWPAGAPARPTAVVPLPVFPADFVHGPGGDVYLTAPGTPAEKTMVGYRVGPAGQVRWRQPLASDIFNDQLRLGPDGAVYQVGRHWIPITTPSGAPLSVTEQQRLTRSYRPLPGGGALRLTASSAQEVRVAVLNAAGRTVRSWRITSDTELGLPLGAWPELTGGDPVVLLDVFDWNRTTEQNRMEQVALRLTSDGAVARVHLDNANWGDTPVTEYRLGPDGALYQLRTSRTAGVTIARYRLGAVVPAATPTGGAVVPPPAGRTATAAPTAAPTGAPVRAPTAAATLAPTRAATAPAGHSALGWWLASGGGLLALLTSAALLVLLWRRQRRPQQPDPVVVPQHLHADLGQPRELTDTQQH
jgi:hypothetical protein